MSDMVKFYKKRISSGMNMMGPSICLWGKNLTSIGSKEKREHNWRLLSAYMMDDEFHGRNVSKDFFWNDFDHILLKNGKWDFRQKSLVLDKETKNAIVMTSTMRLSLNYYMTGLNRCRISFLADDFHLEMLEKGINGADLESLILSDEIWGCLYSRLTKHKLYLYSPKAHFMEILFLQIELLSLYHKLDWMESVDPNRIVYTKNERKLLILNVINKRREIAKEERLYSTNFLQLTKKRRKGGKSEKEKLYEILKNINQIYKAIFLDIPSAKMQFQVGNSDYKEFLQFFNDNFAHSKEFLRRFQKINDTFYRFQKIKDSFIKGDNRSRNPYEDGIGSFMDYIAKKQFLYFIEPDMQDRFPNEKLGHYYSKHKCK